MNGLRLATSKCTRRAAVFSLPSRAWGTRSIHRRRPLPYSIEEGLGNFLPPQALKVVAEDYQEGLLERLNEQIARTDLAGKRISDIVIQTAAYRPQALIFNYASLALNNSFFLDQLKPPPKPPHRTHEGEISNALLNRIRDDWGSFPNFVDTFVNAASGMSSAGFLWFVCDTRGNTAILPTLGSGTLLIRSRSYINPDQGLIAGESMQQEWDGADDFDAPTPAPLQKSTPPGVFPSSPLSGASGSPSAQMPNQPLARYLHSSSAVANTPSYYDPSTYVSPSKVELINVGEKLLPLFCVSLHEHAWLSAGYGVWGKEQWLKEFWTVLDWGKVSQMYEKHWTKMRNV
ncbi:hypothetical protein PC9H_005429 [Pleurotus ostreatus]|uniref:Manganese/iron superoxide dismutase C-terminal domain-containing protein n=1 Tax=Pleurotus ostreatus TaxID=5322 RepID=A0A8H7DUD6_PLEOS|nr:uncharacterized protein PC9H_005429 [Pleurotus ostreatus]KAF7433477.1 hypothetical protein PC9H_005429 [Pleurotus ostreatus]KAJ8697816.1 hypothetical protein PTI98_004588 [Pleurotus ostreatus]